MKYLKAKAGGSGSCVWIPSAKNGKQSILFQDLMGRFHDRGLAKKIWNFAQNIAVNAANQGLERDSNGELTYDSVNKLLDLDTILATRQSERSKAYEEGIISKNGKPAVHDNHREALDAVEHFNKEAKDQIAVAYRTTTGKLKTELRDRTMSSVSQAENNARNNAINKLLLSRLHSIGFDVSFADDPTYSGVFDPALADKNTETLLTVIQIAHGERGQEAFPEEFSHVIISGLSDDPIKQRINKAFTDDVVKEVLGKDYDKFYNLYKDGKMPVEDRLREEAEGQVLADVIKTGDYHSPYRTLFQRFWQRAKKFLGMLNEKDIRSAVALARDSVRPLAERVYDNTISTVISKDLVMKHEKMYNLTDKLAKLEELAEDGLTILSKRLNLILREQKPDASTKFETQQIKTIRGLISDKEYAAACYSAMLAISQQVENIAKANERFAEISDSAQDMHVIAEEANLVRRMGSALQAYLPFVKAMQSLNKLREKGTVEMEDATASDIIKLANEAMDTLKTIQDEYTEMRFSVLKQLVLLYYGDSPMLNEQTDEAKAASVELLLQRADRDIRLGDTSLFSAGASTSPIINIIHNIITRKQSDRDAKINILAAEMQEADTKLKAAGYSNDFVYQKDSLGVPTGYYVGPVDVAKFERERQDFIKGLEEAKVDPYTKKVAINEWEADHTEEVVVDPETGRTETLPSSKYYSVDFQKGWSQAQKDYYATLMNNKAKLDSLLPVPAQHLYNAPQKRKDITQAFDNGTKGLKKQIWGKLRQEMCVVDDNPDYAKNVYMIEDGVKVVATDFDGRPIKKVPIYFTNRLDDLSNLSTDATNAMISYAAMAINYGEMNEIADAMVLMEDHLNTDFEVTQTEAGQVIKDVFRTVGTVFQRDYAEKGGRSNIARYGTKYIDRMVFNDKKNKLGTRKIFGKTIDLDALFNSLMSYNSILRMGVNPLSGTVNLMQGEYQIFTEAFTGRHFDMKDAMSADVEYKKLLADHIAHFNDTDRHDKMSLLIRTFNSSEDFFRDIQDNSFKNSAYKRLLGKGNLYFLNTMGEHKIHAQTMIAMLKHAKVTRLSDNKEVSLYDCIEPVHTDKGWLLHLTSDIKFKPVTEGDQNSYFMSTYTQNLPANEDGSVTVKQGDELELFKNINVYVNHVNQGLFGGYSDRERGTINSTMLGRLVMQFRQWMPGTIDKMFSGTYYNAITGTKQEGSFTTLWKKKEFIGQFLFECLKDIKNIKTLAPMYWNKLTPDEKANLKLCVSQTFFVWAIYFLAQGLLGWKDEDDAAKRFAAFSLKRLSSEVLAVYPSTRFIKENLVSMLKSPIPSMSTWENVFELTDPNMWFSTIKSGRYKGWNHALKTLYTLTPVAYNVGKVRDLAEYNYIFNIFN